MKGVWNFLKSRWRRPKHKGVSGNFSTIVIITGIVIGGWILTGGEYPDVYPTYTTLPIEGEPLPDQPTHPRRFSLNFSELRFKVRTNDAVPAECEKAALVFLVDISTSMIQPSSKLGNFKSSLESFVSTLPPETIFGLYTFSSPNGQPWPNVAIGPLSSVKPRVTSALNSIVIPDNAATYMRQGFQSVEAPLAAAKQANPDYKFNLIFISDGVPEEQFPPGCVQEYTIGDCNDGSARHYDKRYDPTETSLGQPDIPQAIKASGVAIYSVAIYNAADTQVFPELKTLMDRISSGPGYSFESQGGETLTNIYNQIKTTACSS